ncbi:MAG: hypothetical protein AAGH40_12325 [Verrucomicrobiota bacterium]
MNVLNPEEKLEFAAELARAASKSDNSVELSYSAVEIIEQQLDYFIAHPEPGISWEDLRQKKDA